MVYVAQIKVCFFEVLATKADIIHNLCMDLQVEELAQQSAVRGFL